jgi:hypothetical protein
MEIEPGADERTDYGIKCRPYPTNDGLRRTPCDEWVLAAAQRAYPVGEASAWAALPGATRSASPG